MTDTKPEVAYLDKYAAQKELERLGVKKAGKPMNVRQVQRMMVSGEIPSFLLSGSLVVERQVLHKTLAKLQRQASAGERKKSNRGGKRAVLRAPD